MSSTANNREQHDTTEGSPTSISSEFLDSEPHKNQDVFDSEENDLDHGDSEEVDDGEDEEELTSKEAEINIIDQLVEMFIEKNGREPNEEEVKQWIDVFKSLENKNEQDCEPKREVPISVDAASE
mmetsp:Transcript_26583/g.52965  ORF Transcript_26583/g.52965 Transcript_26583/m.52965 type:complete len:125 (-) Transcript_26583:32-406(-)